MNKTNLPKHIAIIMDGNGRWAQSHGKNRTYGHYIGSQVADSITRYCAAINIQYLTLYTFSTENWKRPKSEVTFLMNLLKRGILKKSKIFLENDIRFNTIGDISKLNPEIQEVLTEAVDKTKNGKTLTLTLALNYGSRYEITQAVRKIAQLAKENKLKIEDISQETINNYLYTNNMPNVDLLIRTAGEKRISNFLLWQSSYAEFVFFDKYWPDFTEDDLQQAILEFQNRKRRFGGL